jgi:hypothetical protein
MASERLVEEKILKKFSERDRQTEGFQRIESKKEARSEGKKRERNN